METKQYDIIVLGAGASGLMCAMVAGQRGKSALVIDHNDRPGVKVAISGGGRCNFSNHFISEENFVSANPRFCLSAISRYGVDDILAFVERHDIPWEEREHGQLFLTQSASDIINAMRKDAEDAGVYFAFECEIESVTRKDDFRIETSQGAFSAGALVLATGGMSYAKLGASDLGYRLAKQFGLDIIEPRSGLVPLLWDKTDLAAFGDLSGISVHAEVSLGKTKFSENVLFTHQGLSGPAILQLSNYYKPGDTITLNLVTEIDVEKYLMQKKTSGVRQEVRSVLDGVLPSRLSRRLCELYGWNGLVNEQKDATLRKIAETLHRWRITPGGADGFDKAEVTAGGIDTKQFSPKTFECRSVPGLYAIGEALDVTGHLGGYNLHWAWASANAVGEAV